MADSPRDRRLTRALLALEGLSVGDAFGERFFGPPEVVEGLIASRTVPPAPWTWTDDTAMALSVLEVLEEHAGIDPHALATLFARRYAAEPRRGYGGTAHEILQAIGMGVPWQLAAGRVFDGGGSMGNGAAMRVAPVGAWFAGDLDAVAEHAARSADPTHAHPDGKAGAIAVAIGAALAMESREGGTSTTGSFDPTAYLRAVHARTPNGATRDGIARAIDLPASREPRDPCAGSRVPGARLRDVREVASRCAHVHHRVIARCVWSRTFTVSWSSSSVYSAPPPPDFSRAAKAA